MHRNLILALLVPMVLLAGCADPPHRCPLKKGPGCEAVSQIYVDAREANPNQNGQWLPKTPTSVVGRAPSWSASSGFYGPGQVGMPVFKEPRVYRAWIAPYIDSSGNMHSGQYVYFSTPGEWSYGSLTRSGEASPGLYGPIPPQDSFFRSLKHGSGLSMPSGKPPSPSSKNKSSKTVDGITQPKVILTPNS